MARRVTWTNNSTSYDGTNIYRDTTIDPQSLPAPIATVGPVAQGATVEYIDTDDLQDGDYCYVVRDFDDSGESPLSDSYCITVGEDYSSAQVGDEIGGGIYAGTITYADASEYHIIFAKQSGELVDGSGDVRWKVEQTETAGTNDDDDGKANTDAMIAASEADHPAASHCVGYTNDGYSDWYLPAINELEMAGALVSQSHPEFSTALTDYRRASTQSPSSPSSWTWVYRFSDGNLSDGASKTATYPRVRPIRRVPV